MNTEATNTLDSVYNQSKTTNTFFGLALWEIIALALSVVLIAFIAIPNYFSALETLRGRECSHRLTLMADCLTYLAERHDTQPGEQICELFELNELLERVQGGEMIRFDTSIPAYYKVGAEPDCIDVGDHQYSLILGEDGKVQPPTCTLGDEPRFENTDLHQCDMSLVDGELDVDF